MGYRMRVIFLQENRLLRSLLVMVNKLMSLSFVLALVSGSLFVASCGEKETDAAAGAQPAGEEGAKIVIQEIIDNPGQAAELSMKLRPTTEDYAAVFSDAEFAKKAQEVYDGAWDAGALVVKAKPDQTEIKLFSATTEDLLAGNEKAKQFPGGFKQVASKFNKGITIYVFKLIKPGEKYGMSFNGLIHVNGHWRIFPKPWRIK